MDCSNQNRKRSMSRQIFKDNDGQSLVELAVAIPVLTLLLAYAIDFGYFFLAVATITSAARNAAQYSVMGFSAPAQSALPVAGPSATTQSVAAVALADMTSLVSASTTTSVQVCSKSLGMSGSSPNCASYGPAANTYVPQVDPEAPVFILQRVDITYTVHPPVPMSFFGYSLLPNMAFHRQVSMRVMD